jgi:hypothetical protein
MGCPDWTRLLAWRERRDGIEPDGWGAAVAHLDDCPDCRRQALAADPTLLFARPAPVPLDAAGEAARMRQAVAAMRRASRLLPGERRGAAEAASGAATAVSRLVDRPFDRLIAATAARLPGWRLAAALALAAGLLWASPVPVDPGSATAPAAVAMVAGTGPTLAAAALPAAVRGQGIAAAATVPADDLTRLPVFEGLDRPRDANVYQLDGDGLLVVMIVDETLDV